MLSGDIYILTDSKQVTRFLDRPELLEGDTSQTAPWGPPGHAGQ